MEKEDDVLAFQNTWAIRLDKTYRMYKEIRSDFQRFGEYEITLFDNLNHPVVVFKVDEKFLENWQRRFVVNLAEDLSATGATGKKLVREIFSNKKKNRNPLREEEGR
jgi:hypothetical protein